MCAEWYWVSLLSMRISGSPPCAGKTGRRADLQPAVGHHPRMRGEDVKRDVVGDWACGITPACAGKTHVVTAEWWLDGDHPRMRGEDSRTCSKSSSRARITPACAGKTSRCRGRARSSTDHPRMRGEDTTRRVLTQRVPGSPPHARGRRRVVIPAGAGVGITPACAGKTVPASTVFWTR